MNPWFPGSTDFVHQTAHQRKLKVCDLIDPDTGSWNVELLVSLFGYSNSMVILSQVRPVNSTARSDSLVFSQTQSGVYSVKKMYNHLQGQGSNNNSEEGELWRAVWKKGDVVPRVRVFLWRLLSNGLPLTNTLAHRGVAIDNTCCTCGEAQEDGKHLMFECPFSRACWFGAPFPLRSHLLQGTVKEVFTYLINGTDAEQWTMCANTMWAIWRCRNDMIYNAQQPIDLKFKGFLHAISSESYLVCCRTHSLSPWMAMTTPATLMGHGPLNGLVESAMWF